MPDRLADELRLVDLTLLLTTEVSLQLIELGKLGFCQIDRRPELVLLPGFFGGWWMSPHLVVHQRPPWFVYVHPY